MQRSEIAARWALLFGNFVIGTGVLAPAALINPLCAAFSIDTATQSLLIAYGAALLFIEAPLLAFLTNRVDRRRLLTGSLVVYAIGHMLSAFAPTFGMLLTARLLMIGSAAVFTPQAASAIGLFVATERRAGAVAFIFLGWSTALAAGVPLMSLLGERVGWSAAYLILGVACSIAAAVVFATLPGGLIAPRLSLAAWRKVLTSREILLLLGVTTIFVAGQFTQYPFIAADLKTRLGIGPDFIWVLLGVYGVAGVLGSATSAAILGRLGAPLTASLALAAVIVGLFLWSVSGASIIVATAGLFVWGGGGGPAISSQQARLIAADPEAASASVALNTSVLYAGQAFGTSLGRAMLQRDLDAITGYVGVALVCIALTTSVIVWRRYEARREAVAMNAN